MIQHNMITNSPNFKGDSNFVNSEIELTDDMQKECNPDTKYKFKILKDYHILK